MCLSVFLWIIATVVTPVSFLLKARLKLLYELIENKVGQCDDQWIIRSVEQHNLSMTQPSMKFSSSF